MPETTSQKVERVAILLLAPDAQSIEHLPLSDVRVADAVVVSGRRLEKNRYGECRHLSVDELDEMIRNADLVVRR
jgi:hypothetical protein